MPIIVKGLKENEIKRKDISNVYKYVSKYFLEKGLDIPENIIVKVFYKPFLFPPSNTTKIYSGVYISNTLEENIVWINFNALTNIVLYRLLIAFLYIFFRHNLVKVDIDKIISICNEIYLGLLKYVGG